MSMEQLMALVPLEAAMSHKDKGRRSRWEKTKKTADGSRWGSETVRRFRLAVKIQGAFWNF